MAAEQIIQELCIASGVQTEAGNPPESLIGLFQVFRPHGIPANIEFGETAGGEPFAKRLHGIYRAVSNSQRSDSMQDAYFVVRNPPMLDADRASMIATRLLDDLLQLCKALELDSGVQLLQKSPDIRVLEGKAPKKPKDRDEKSALLLLLEEAIPANVDALFPASSLASRLSEPLYFVACDRLLRDYLRWPLLEAHPDSRMAAMDSLKEYFELWRHGAKLRVFNNEQLDVYLPRRASGTLLDVGQFAIRPKI